MHSTSILFASTGTTTSSTAHVPSPEIGTRVRNAQALFRPPSVVSDCVSLSLRLSVSVLCVSLHSGTVQHTQTAPVCRVLTWLYSQAFRGPLISAPFLLARPYHQLGCKVRVLCGTRYHTSPYHTLPCLDLVPTYSYSPWPLSEKLALAISCCLCLFFFCVHWG